MDPSLPDLAPHFSCGLDREDILETPPVGDTALASLLDAEVPEEFRGVHCPWHFLSFAAHVKRLVTDPVEVRTVDGLRCVQVLGQAVFRALPDGKFSFHIWQRESDEAPVTLDEIMPIGTPFLDFPRTDLWTEKLLEALQREARLRIVAGGLGDARVAEDWADWVWAWTTLKVVTRVDLRRLRARIRGALQLDRRVLAMLRLRGAAQRGVRWSVCSYNNERGWLEATLKVQREAPALLPVFFGLRDEPDFDRRLEPVKALRRLTRTLGVTPQQWRALVGSGRKGLRLQRALSREFQGASEHRNACEFLALLALLRPTRLPPLEFWRQLLSMTGTRWNIPDAGYATELAKRQVVLRHLVRVLEARARAGEAPPPAEDQHAVFTWIADVCRTRLHPSERQGGWAWLLRQGREHRELLRRKEVGTREWRPLLPGFEHGRYRVVPVTSSEGVWAEAIAMRHCADQYEAGCAEGKVLMFSVQRYCGKRVATAAFAATEDGWRAIGLTGKANSEPPGDAYRVMREITVRLRVLAPLRSRIVVESLDMADWTLEGLAQMIGGPGTGGTPDSIIIDDQDQSHDDRRAA